MQSTSSFSLDRSSLILLKKALSFEWLETNGLGDYATSTSLYCPTRRYHGLLVAKPPGHAKRHNFLVGFDVEVRRPQGSLPLSTFAYRGLFSPHGYQAAESFEAFPHPRLTYHFGGLEIRYEVVMPQGKRAVLLHWSVSGLDDPVELLLRPLLAFRAADALTSENLALDPRTRRRKGHVSLRPYASLPALDLTVEGAPSQFDHDPVWYRGVELSADLDRGYDGHEDLFSPGRFRVQLAPESGVFLGASIEGPLDAPRALFQSSWGPVDQPVPTADDYVGQLERGAEDFLIQAPAPAGGTRQGVVAGYPWFTEWGRDSFLSLPGLLASRGRVEELGQALEDATVYLKDGLLPNIFEPTVADSHYGSVDAALWFARAVRLYDKAGGSRERIVDGLLPAMLEIGAAYEGGTGLGIAADDGGLITAGDESLNATWMDAQINGVPVTPRHGQAVEINALWYHLIAYLELILAKTDRKPESRVWMQLRRRAKRSFLERFWLTEQRYLADVWRDGERDTAVRPNMVLAAALEFSPLTRGKRTDVVQRAEAELLTERGLRTLSPKNPAYEGRYQGGTDARDGAYHQGTVWPWLFGYYVEAALRAIGPRPHLVERLTNNWHSIAEHVQHAGLGHVSEVFDGDTPHRPGGTIAQAWNTAELLRAWRLLEEART